MNKVLRVSLRVLLYFIVVAGIFSCGVIYSSYTRCDYRTFSMIVSEVDGKDALTGLYQGKGIYTYPKVDKDHELTFSAPTNFKKGEWVDQCLNLQFFPFDIHHDKY